MVQTSPKVAGDVSSKKSELKVTSVNIWSILHILQIWWDFQPSAFQNTLLHFQWYNTMLDPTWIRLWNESAKALWITNQRKLQDMKRVMLMRGLWKVYSKFCETGQREYLRRGSIKSWMLFQVNAELSSLIFVNIISCFCLLKRWSKKR